MNKKTIIVGIVALLLGVGLGLLISQTQSYEAPLSGASPSVQELASASNQAAGGETLASNQAAGGQTSASSQAESGETPASNQAAGGDISASSQAPVVESGTYTSKDEVAAYIHEFGHLPSNYISKSKAKKAGWVAKEGNLDDVLPGMSIGGSEFYNDEGQLPDAPGRTWTECDINYEGGYRGAERIVFSSDGLIFYTADHYKTFEQLY